MSQAAANLKPLFTIGHSDHELARLIELLSVHCVDAVADVRSSPYSRLHPQFNRELLADRLKSARIKYVFMGQELGARRSERESYQGRQARYDLITPLPAFQDGLRRIRKGLETRSICLLCAEKDPITCHRMVLVCRELRADPIDIRHIGYDGKLETTAEAEVRLRELAGLPPAGLFESPAELIEQAYARQAAKIAYTEAEPNEETSNP